MISSEPICTILNNILHSKKTHIIYNGSTAYPLFTKLAICTYPIKLSKVEPSNRQGHFQSHRADYSLLRLLPKLPTKKLESTAL